MAINPISGALSGAGLTPPSSGATGDAGGTTAFGDALGNLLGNVEHTNAEANSAIGRMLEGSGDVHEAMIAMQRADISLQITVQVRNKLVQAYQDIMRMPV